mmetsp:Transcript_40295/g.65147  ORF Transcript_40295/g.65147 Transcript_40295/m.65147 type:complete len:333 (+) Transcript_40295:1-999(+)
MASHLVENPTECSRNVFREALTRAEITLPKLVVHALWYVSDKSGCSHSSMRRVSDLQDRLVMYLSTGQCYESVRGLFFDELHVPTLQDIPRDEVRAAFVQVDEKTGFCGVIDTHEVCELMRLLSQQGMSLPVVEKTFKQLKLHIDEDALKEAFVMVDTNSDDNIDLTEFLCMIDRLIDTILPKKIFSLMGMQPQQILFKVVGMGMSMLTMCAFLSIALGAFHVDVKKEAADMGQSFLRAGLAGLAALGLRRESSMDDLEKQYQVARVHLYRLTGVSNSQLETRRRAYMASGSSVGGTATLKRRGQAQGAGGGNRGGTMKEEEEEEKDEDEAE